MQLGLWKGKRCQIGKQSQQHLDAARTHDNATGYRAVLPRPFLYTRGIQSYLSSDKWCMALVHSWCKTASSPHHCPHTQDTPHSQCLRTQNKLPGEPSVSHSRKIQLIRIPSRHTFKLIDTALIVNRQCHHWNTDIATTSTIFQISCVGKWGVILRLCGSRLKIEGAWIQARPQNSLRAACRNQIGK